MAYRNKTYVCFDADEDIHYYRLLLAMKAKDPDVFPFYNAHDLYPMQRKKLTDNDEKYIKGKLKERFLNTKCFVILVGGKTKNLYKYVRWEIEVALNLDIPTIVINLNKQNRRDDFLCPPIIKNELAIHIPFKKDAISKAMRNWPESHIRHRKNGDSGSYYYSDFD